jgi:head-tail adaptor
MISNYFNLSAILLRKSEVVVDGEPVEVFTQVGSSFSVGMDALSGDIRLTRDKKDTDASHTVFSDIRDIRAGDRLRISGNDYDVIFVDDPGNMGHHLEIDVRLLK